MRKTSNPTEHLLDNITVGRMKVLPIAYQKQWGVNYSINDKRRDFMSDNNKKVQEKEVNNMGKKPAQMGLGIHPPNNDRNHRT